MPHRFIRPDGEVRWLQSFGRFVRDASGAPIQIVGGNIDVTDQRRLEERLTQAHRMEVVGRLSAGLVHNFNNLLSVMLPTLNMLADAVPSDLREAVEEARVATVRATDLARQLMTFARGEPSGAAPDTDCDSTVTSVVNMCRRFFERYFTFELALGAPDARVGVRATELEQALMNVLINSRDALRDAATSNPRIVVSTRRDGPGTVVVQIADNGPGVPEALRRELFRPFFTTKPSGVGTGLGLASALETLQRCGGTARYVDRPGAGACFELILPERVDDQRAQGPAAVAPSG